MRWIIASSLRLRLLVLGVAAAVMVAGITQLRDTPVDVLPEFTPPYVEVQTEALGLSAEEVEQLVTVPLEADLLNGMKGATVLRSESVPGLSSITMLFQPGTGISEARQLVQEQLTQAHANPNVSQPPQMIQPLSSESRVMMIGLSPEKMSPIEASVLARWTIRPRLLAVDGVANVAIFGARDRQLQVLVDPERLRDKKVTLQQVIRTAGNAQLVSPLSFLEASTPGTGGFIDTANQRLQVRHILPSVTPEKLARVPLEGTAGQGPNGRPRRLGDVTTVVEDHQPLIGDAITNGKTGLLLVVEKFPGADPLSVTRGVEDALDEMRPGLTGLKIDDSAFRPADFITEATDNLTLAVIIGCALLALVLFALLYAWRTALIAPVAFVVSLTAAALVLTLTDASFNALLFAGLAAAVIAVIDDGVIDVERISRAYRNAGAPRGLAARATIVRDAASQTRSPMAYATLMAALVALPVFFLQGLTGSFFDPAARAYVLALAVSMVVALVITPGLSLMVIARPGRGAGGGPSPLARWTSRGYEGAVTRVVARPAIAFAAGGLAVVAGLALIPALHGPVLTSFKDRDLLVHLDGPPGTSRPEMSRIVQRASRDLRAVPGVQDVGGHIGRAVTGDQIVDVNSSELWVKMDRDADYAKTRAAVERVVNSYPGFNRSVVTYEKQRLRDVGAADDRQVGDSAKAATDFDVLTGADRRPLTVRVFGEDFGVLQRQGERVKRLLGNVDGVANPRVERFVQQPTVSIEVNLDRAQRYGIEPGDVRRKAATLLSGIQVGSLFEHQKVFEVVVRATPDTRRSVADVKRLLIDAPGGGHVRLSQIADIKVRPTPQVIQRDASSRRIDVTAGVSGRSLEDVKADVRKLMEHTSFPLEYHAQVIGDATGRRATTTQFIGFGIAAAIGIFLLLQAAFRSWRLAFGAFLALPAGLLGGELAGLIDGGDFSVGSLIGLIAILGIAARQSVALIDRCQRLEDAGDASGPGPAVRGALERLTPLLITAVAGIAALLPFIALGTRAGLEVVHPMAVVMVGGLITTTLFSLFLVPAVYGRLGTGTTTGMDSELELLHRWAGIEPDEEPISDRRPGAVGAGVDTDEGR